MDERIIDPDSRDEEVEAPRMEPRKRGLLVPTTTGDQSGDQYGDTRAWTQYDVGRSDRVQSPAPHSYRGLTCSGRVRLTPSGQRGARPPEKPADGDEGCGERPGPDQ